MAGSWLEEVYKPSRRFKKITLEDLAVQAKIAPKKQVTSLRSNVNNNEEGDNIFDEVEDEEEDE